MATTTTSTTTTTTNTERRNTKMKAIQLHEFVSNFDNNNNDVMKLSKDVEIPTPQKDQLLIRTLACSISPGDIIMTQGNLVFLHPDKFPFIPGMDVCGIVVDSNGHEEKFQKGDVVVASNGISPTGGMAEYMAIPVSECVLKPKNNVSNEMAAACSSAITARNAVLDHVKPGDRVLILGGSGGVGSAAITLAKNHAKASFVATTSSQTQLCKSLGADVVINYKKQNWWEMNWEQPFDKIIDTVGGGNWEYVVNNSKATTKTKAAGVLLKTGKLGGEFIAVTGDDPKPDASTWWKAIKFFAKMPLRPMYTYFMKRHVPSYVLLMPYDFPQGRKQVLDMMEDGTLSIQLDTKSPLPFTEDGVREAFAIVASGHAHGKVVVSMSME